METGIGKALSEFLTVAIDKWYSMLLLLGFLGLVLSATVPLYFDNGLVALISAACLFTGCAEGETRKKTRDRNPKGGPYLSDATVLTERSIYIVRVFTPMGILLYALAAIFIALAAYRAWVVFA